MEITFFYIPVGTQTEATSMGEMAVDRQLAACANIFPIQSVFPWSEGIHHEQEHVLVLKTIPTMKMLLREFIEANHTYDTPCILSWEAEVNEKYGNWMNEQVKQY